MHHERILDVGPLGLHAVVLVGSSSGKLPTFSESVVVKARHPQLALSALGGIGALLPLLLPPVPSRSAISYVLRGQHVFRALVLLVVASLQGGRGASQNLAWFRHYGGPRMLATVLRSCRPRYLERGLLETLLAAVAAVGGKARFQTFARFVDAHAEREVSSLCHDDDDQSTVRGFLCSIRSTFSYLVAVDSLTHQQGDQKGDREAEENEDDQFSPIEFPNQYDGTEQKSSDKPPVSSKVWRERGTLCEEIMNELIFAPRIWMRASFAVQCRLWEALRSRCRVGHPDRALLRQHGHGVQRLMEILRDYYRVPPAGFDDKRKTTITVFYSPLASRASASSLSPPFSSPASSSSSFSSSSSSPSSPSSSSAPLETWQKSSKGLENTTAWDSRIGALCTLNTGFGTRWSAFLNPILGSLAIGGGAQKALALLSEVQEMGEGETLAAQSNLSFPLSLALPAVFTELFVRSRQIGVPALPLLCTAVLQLATAELAVPWAWRELRGKGSPLLGK